MKKTYAQKIKELEIQLQELKKEIESKKYEPVICNGLMWSDVADKTMTWDEAMKYAGNLKEGDYTDWRLPTVNELINIFNYNKGKPDVDFITNTYFWSSTEYSNDATYAWRVYPNHGNTNYYLKTVSYAVRCVRRVKEQK